ncbi:alkaline phosphatase family protein [Streptomyces sp. ACA25]|uniref:alkaline phosphatase family protein n=1 Tax=Streptomyces sp. ACA25 TaxID=3022596 RepID=UPI0023073836|nr:alkaline phosphatase family protein [Streptomyces sp. ACA25]MDB1089283.1 alkaline phosphatase family protein [Streptomyces sp. ACA25]
MHVTGWRTGSAALLRVVTVWAVGTVTLLVLAVVLPRFHLQSADSGRFTSVGVTAALGAGAFGLLHVLVWPWLVRALLLVPALALGSLVFLLNGFLLWLALSIIPHGRGEAGPGTAVVVAAVMSATSSATSTFLAVRDRGVLGRRLRRLAGLRRSPGAPHRRPRPPGTVFLQLDGIGYDVLREAVQGERPLMPTVAGLCRDSHRLIPWTTDWPSQTGASQLGILHGSNAEVPAFRWYEKDTGEMIISNRPSSAAELQRRAVARAGNPGLLAHDGASRGNLFTGGAGQAALVLSVAARRRRGQRSRAGYFAYFSDPAHAGRTFLSFAAEIVRELSQSLRSRLRGDRPRISRGGLYPLLRAFATVVQRDVVVASVHGDILNSRTAVYADLVAYDEVAHHSGPRSRDTHQVLARLDHCVARILEAIEHAPRPYHLVLLSDHGQSPGETFETAYGMRLEELVRSGCGRPVPRQMRRPDTGAEARNAARAALHRPEETAVPVTAEPDNPPGRPAVPVVLGSGNLGLVSFPDLPGRASRETIEERFPRLLRTLASHPGIGFLLVRSDRHGEVVLGTGGGEHRLDTGEVLGTDPLALYGPGAAEAVHRVARFHNTPDIMINSAYDPATGTVHAFEDQIGSHGGLGGEQNRAFLLSPTVLSAPVGDGEELRGAEAVHRVLRRWLAEAAAAGPGTSLPAVAESRP